jgi:hypothetical protein
MDGDDQASLKLRKSNSQSDEKHEAEEEAGQQQCTVELNVLLSVEHNGWKNRLGQRFTIRRLEDQELCQAVWGRKEEGGLVLIRTQLGEECDCPPDLLTNTTTLKAAFPLYSFLRQSRKFKQQVLYRANICEPRGCQIEIMTNLVKEPNEDHVTMYQAHLGWAIDGTYPRESDQIGFIPTQVSRNFLDCHMDGTQEEEEKLCIKRCTQLAKFMLEDKRLILVPVRPPGAGAGHFTLLVLSKTSDVEEQLGSTGSGWESRYYDSLHVAKPANIDASQRLLREFSIGGLGVGNSNLN